MLLFSVNNEILLLKLKGKGLVTSFLQYRALIMLLITNWFCYLPFLDNLMPFFRPPKLLPAC